MFADKIKSNIANLEAELQSLQSEMDRVDAVDGHCFGLRKRAQDLAKQIESNKKLLKVFGPSDLDEGAQLAVNL